jgi:ubiquitin-conjugating enzyme E2 N
VFIPDAYPQTCPQAKFETRIYHPNIDFLGRICYPLLRPDELKQETTVFGLLLSFRVLLATPNPDDPLALGSANEFRNNAVAAQETARKYTRTYAIGTTI